MATSASNDISLARAQNTNRCELGERASGGASDRPGAGGGHLSDSESGTGGTHWVWLTSASRARSDAARSQRPRSAAQKTANHLNQASAVAPGSGPPKPYEIGRLSDHTPPWPWGVVSRREFARGTRIWRLFARISPRLACRGAGSTSARPTHGGARHMRIGAGCTCRRRPTTHAN